MKDSKIAIYVTEAYYLKEQLYGVSGHVQIPLKTTSLLSEKNINVDFITTKPKGANHLMIDLSENVKIKTVLHSTKKWPKKGVSLFRSFIQIVQLIILIKKENYSLIHFFGGYKTGMVAVISKLIFANKRVFFSPISEPEQIYTGSGFNFFRNLDLIISNSEFVAQKWKSFVGEHKSVVIKPGIVKNIIPIFNDGQRDIILFWRNADYNNGADIMISIVKQLAPVFKRKKFVFAIRPGSEFEHSINELSFKFTNVFVYIHPYENQITIEKLLSQSLLVIAPYRKLSINPQISILESLFAGVPVVASNVESNNEVIQHGITGIIVGINDSKDYVRSIKKLLFDPEFLRKLRENSIKQTREKYNWNSYIDHLKKIYSGN
ncbi:Glycosyl transferases group 1 [Desulfocicer vacuolatum DSM 3385]|uniref:Glycosyl transferases group 1 n=1 Tax=Desulfocicer vacuolatum DSM 3385 TaxID=1121400 RepID=A0A1W1Z5P8_9BACT|nr:glycosyltransferase family 4 protein [Desulfocicer vacuolatum]SMC43441.1 Glycosyl transferases group 1 [Desulfocicer vacuolatum DSM 3385]